MSSRPTRRAESTNGSPAAEFVCPFCKRPGARKTKHHLIPKSLGGKITVDCCRDCHKAIHTCFPHRDLKKKYHTVPVLLSDERFRTMVRFIAKQDPSRKMKFARPKDQRWRGKFR